MDVISEVTRVIVDRLSTCPELEQLIGVPYVVKVYNHGQWPDRRVEFCLEATLPYATTNNGDVSYNVNAAMFSLAEVPFSNHYLVSCGVSTHYLIQGRGIGSFLHKVRLDSLQEVWKEFMKFYYNRQPLTLLCTSHKTNEAEQRILKKFNWTLLRDDETQLWMKEVGK